MGSAKIDSLVSVDDVAAHLRLLGAIRTYLRTLLKLRHIVFIDGAFRPTSSGQLLFARSAYRLKLWIENVLRPSFELYGPRQGLDEPELPPFDVLVMLHSYMLHPRSFYEDTIRVYPELALLSGFPLTQVSEQINDLMEYTPTAKQVAFWEFATGEVFVAPFSTAHYDTFKIICPSCTHPVVAHWTDTSSDVLSASDLSVQCKDCKLQLTDPVLSVAAFLKDIGRSVSGQGVGVAGTLLSAEGKFDLERSTAITSKIATAVDFQKIKKLPLGDAVRHLQKHSHSMFEDIEVEFLSCYGNPGGFSLDLGNAVLRQGSFASTMFHAGWTEPAFPSEAPSTIAESIKRYRGFLELTMKEQAPIGPTSEIDLVWHTHQLSVNYREDLMELFGWFLDHIDVAPEEVLASAFSNASDVWEKAFGTPYDGYFEAKVFRRQ
ncbi:hypothetical protein LshimejAT787_1203550 [Lyophyllum shimeji]|uniref:Uncharacterized protein n=1 Tax=Lyophyllum shimeji TaxID=47721 RepID=A0A9P3PWG3_LYOSH|nr:hypothetical protein LshimejAT787_1203550 [Lyophyllum shimeji]